MKQIPTETMERRPQVTPDSVPVANRPEHRPWQRVFEPFLRLLQFNPGYRGEVNVNGEQPSAIVRPVQKHEAQRVVQQYVSNPDLASHMMKPEGDNDTK